MDNTCKNKYNIIMLAQEIYNNIYDYLLVVLFTVRADIL